MSWVCFRWSAAWCCGSLSPVGTWGRGYLWRRPLPDLLALKLLSKIENRGGGGKEEAGPGKRVALWTEGPAQHEEAGCLVDRLSLGLAG